MAINKCFVSIEKYFEIEFHLPCNYIVVRAMKIKESFV
jgi:hypothetical protein